jgi:hypothetical protein
LRDEEIRTAKQSGRLLLVPRTPPASLLTWLSGAAKTGVSSNLQMKASAVVAMLMKSVTYYEHISNALPLHDTLSKGQLMSHCPRLIEWESWESYIREKSEIGSLKKKLASSHRRASLPLPLLLAKKHALEKTQKTMFVHCTSGLEQRPISL